MYLCQCTRRAHSTTLLPFHTTIISSEYWYYANQCVTVAQLCTCTSQVLIFRLCRVIVWNGNNVERNVLSLFVYFVSQCLHLTIVHLLKFLVSTLFLSKKYMEFPYSLGSIAQECRHVVCVADSTNSLSSSTLVVQCTRHISREKERMRFISIFVLVSRYARNS